MLHPSKREPFKLTLNTDGHSHPVENALAVAALACGVVAFVMAFFPSAHVVGSWVGTLGFGVGLYSQYVSVTTPQRALNIVGLVGSFVGAALGIVHGGFLPTP